MSTKSKTHKAPAMRRGTNVVPFPKTIDPQHKEDVEAATAFHNKFDSILMRGWQKSLAKAQVKSSLGDPDARDDVEFFRLSIARRLRDRDSILSRVIAG